MTVRLIDYIKGTPKDYQKEFFRFALKHRYVLNGSKPGTGKSCMALGPCLLMGGTTLIVCPAYLKQTWEMEIHKWSVKPKKVFIIKEGADADRIPSDFDFVIVSYSLAEKIKIEADNVVIDEVHFIKNPLAKRTVNIAKVVSKTRPKLFLQLSGTPILNNHTEWYVYLKLLSMSPVFNGKKLSIPQESFSAKVCNVNVRQVQVYNKKWKRRLWVEQKSYYGLKDKEYLDSLLEYKYFAVEQDESEIPPLVMKDIFFEDIGLSPSEAEKLQAEFELLADSDSAIATRKKKNAILKVKGTLRLAKDLMETSRDPIVIFSDHVEPCLRLKEALEKLNYKVRVITGSVDTDKRQNFVDELQLGLIDFIIATYDSASTGFTMTSSRNAILNDLPWKAKVLEQALNRLKRLGQKHTVTAYRCNAGPIDYRINCVIERKLTDIGGY